MPSHEIFLHCLASEIKVAVFKPKIFADGVRIIHFKRNELRGSQYHEIIHKKFNRACCMVGIFGSFRSLTYNSFYCQNIFISKRVRSFMSFGVEFRVEYHLCNSGLVPELNENNAP